MTAVHHKTAPPLLDWRRRTVLNGDAPYRLPELAADLFAVAGGMRPPRLAPVPDAHRKHRSGECQPGPDLSRRRGIGPALPPREHPRHRAPRSDLLEHAHVCGTVVARRHSDRSLAALHQPGVSGPISPTQFIESARTRRPPSSRVRTPTPETTAGRDEWDVPAP